jgi:hypothetical protein
MNFSVHLTWVLIQFSQVVCCTKEDVQKKMYAPNKTVELPTEYKVCQEKINFLLEKGKEAKDRRDKVDEKARNLLTLTSVLLGFISSASAVASVKAISLFSILSYVLLFITIFLLTFYFGKDTRQVIDNSYVYGDLDQESSKRELCNDLIRSQNYNDSVTDFMVDLYRTALRYFSLAMLCIILLGIWSSIRVEQASPASNDKVKLVLSSKILSIYYQ